MIAFIWKLIMGGLWKPILKGLALVGLYAKGRVDQNARAKDKAQKETIKAHEVRDDVEDRIDRGGSAKQRLRERWRKS